MSDHNHLTSLPGILVSYLLNVGVTVPDIASAAGVSRASVYYWLKGGNARDTALRKILCSFDLSHLTFDYLCPQSVELSRAFDPRSIELLSRFDQARERFDSLQKNPKAQPELSESVDGKEFHSGFLQLHGKAIFEAAFRYEKLGGSLILACIDNEQLKSAQQIWLDWVRYSSGIDLEVMSQLGVSLPEQNKVLLSDIADSFPEVAPRS